jgi:hypothetical protein
LAIWKPLSDIWLWYNVPVCLSFGNQFTRLGFNLAKQEKIKEKLVFEWLLIIPPFIY